MLIVEIIAKIRRLFREHRSTREISRELRLSRKVVRKALCSDKTAILLAPAVVALLGDIRLLSLREAQVVIGLWQNTYNRVRPHSSLGYRPPTPVSFPDLAFRPSAAAERRDSH